MRLPVRVHGELTVIIGYAPGENGKPLAIVILQGGLAAVRLDEIELLHVPHKLRKKLKRARKHLQESKPSETEDAQSI